MAVLFSESKTKQNLMRSQERDRRETVIHLRRSRHGKKENLQLQTFSYTQQIRSGHMREDTMNC